VTTRAHLQLVRPSAAPAAARPDAPEPEVDPSDLDAVFRRFAPYVARIGARILGRSSDLDDLVQDVFLDAVRGLSGLREPAKVRGWLATVTVRRARRRLQTARLWSLFGAALPEGEVADPGLSPEDRAQLVAVYRALDSIAPDACIAWLLHAVEGHALEEVAAIGGFSRATAHRRITEARRALEEVLRGA
jgi:RNA polymerase sigma-70 factor (ECF subfamily)